MRFGVSFTEWTPWFAWRPVRTMSGQMVWLEWVERVSYYCKDIPVSTPFNLGFGKSYVVRSLPKKNISPS